LFVIIENNTEGHDTKENNITIKELSSIFFFFETANIIHVERMQGAHQLADRRNEGHTKGAAYIRNTQNPWHRTMRLKYTYLKQAYPCLTPKKPKEHQLNSNPTRAAQTREKLQEEA